MAFKAISNTIKKPVMKTIGNTIKKSVKIFNRKKNTVKNIAYGIGEKQLITKHNIGSRSVKYLGGEGIKKFKYIAPQTAREGKQNIQTRSAMQMSEKGIRPLIKRLSRLTRGNELGSLINMVSKSKPQAPFLFTGGLMSATQFNLVSSNDNNDSNNVETYPKDILKDKEAYNKSMEGTSKELFGHQDKHLKVDKLEKEEREKANAVDKLKKEKREKANAVDKLEQEELEKANAEINQCIEDPEKDLFDHQDKNLEKDIIDKKARDEAMYGSTQSPEKDASGSEDVPINKLELNLPKFPAKELKELQEKREKSKGTFSTGAGQTEATGEYCEKSRKLVEDFRAKNKERIKELSKNLTKEQKDQITLKVKEFLAANKGRMAEFKKNLDAVDDEDAKK